MLCVLDTACCGAASLVGCDGHKPHLVSSVMLLAIRLKLRYGQLTAHC